MRAAAACRAFLLCGLLAAHALPAQDLVDLDSADERARIRAIRALAKSPDGFRYIDTLTDLVGDESEEVRIELARTLIKMQSIESQPLLLRATTDFSPTVQALAVDGLVALYVPEYVQSEQQSTLKSMVSWLSPGSSKTSPPSVPAYASVKPEVLEAIAGVLRRSSSDEAKASAARALGILGGKDYADALVQGARSRNSDTIVESLLAIMKVDAFSAGPDIVFLLRDPVPKVQEAAILTVGQLQTPEAVPQLVQICQGGASLRIRAEALTALAKIPDNGQRRLFTRFLSDKEKLLRAAAAEGLGRLGNPADAQVVDHQFSIESAEGVKMSLAFAGVLLGNPLRLAYLIEGLDSKTRRLEARPFLVELARDPEILDKLYIPLSTGSASQRRHLAFVLSASGTEASIPHLEGLALDRASEVSKAAVEALRVLRARL